jgi:zinc transport system substrate-binding protein
MRRAALLVLPALAAAGLLSACGSESGNESGSESGNGAAGGTVSVVASFYPIEFEVQQVGGDHVSVASLTKPGAEPHDVELSPKDVASVADAGLVVYAKGFQPAVDTAVDQEGADHAFDVAPVANLDLAAPPEEEAGDTHTAAPQDAAAAKDPHFWLDPQRYAAVATAIGQRLGEADPAHAAAYTQNATAFTDKLGALDAEFRTTLASRTSSPATRRSGTSASATGSRRSRSRGCPPTSSPPRPSSRRSPTSSRPTASRRSMPRRWWSPPSPRPSPGAPAPGWPRSTPSKG